MRRKFSASNFLVDVRRYGATYANYVGKPLSYVLATPEQPDDANNPLRAVYGNEESPRTSSGSAADSAASCKMGSARPRVGSLSHALPTRRPAHWGR